MSTTNKVLILFCAVAAFIIGAYFNTARVEKVTESTSLLAARLLDGDISVTVQDKLGKLTLVNYWASWCSPCRKEMPVFESMYRQASKDGFQIIGIAIDTPDKAQPFLDSMDITYPILYAEKTGYALMESTGNPQGLLPYSLLLDQNGRILEQTLGQVHEEQIADWLNKYL